MQDADSIDTRALKALRLDNPNDTKEQLQALIEEAPNRLDLRHSLATTLVRMGEAKAAKLIAEDAIRMAKEAQTEQALTLLGQMYSTLAAAYEELYETKLAKEAYETILHNEKGNPFALQGLAFLLFANGKHQEGMQHLREYTEQGADEPEAIAANQQFIETIDLFLKQEEDPYVFIDAHRGSYCEMFDHYDKEMAAKGWIAEAARMRLDDSGQPTIPIIPEGYHEYAATRVDLVNPQTAQPGRIGEQPMVVAFVGYEILAQAPIIFEKQGYDFNVFISTRCPWNHLPIHVRMRSADAKVADPFIGDWYTSGYNGTFGGQGKGYFHEITPPESCGAKSVVYHVDMGRSEARSIDDLLNRLSILNSQNAIESVVIGQGFLPES